MAIRFRPEVVDDGDVVTVIAVLHARRNPEAWHARR
jgi:hypothetical protein